MNDKLKAKVEKAVEDYTDLLIKRIEAANKDLNAESVVKVDEAIRMVGYMVTTLERIDRLCHGNGTGGRDDQVKTLGERITALEEKIKDGKTYVVTDGVYDIDDIAEIIAKRLDVQTLVKSSGK